MRFTILLALSLLAPVIINAQLNFFEGTYEEARAEAKEEGKMLFLDFYADWCVPCKQMERYGFRDKDFARVINSQFIALKVDVDQFSGMDIAENFKVNKYPTLIIADAKGAESKRTEGYQSADELKALVKAYDR